MTWKYDASLTSSDYLDLARKRRRRLGKDSRRYAYLDWDFDFDIDAANLATILDPQNWSDEVRAENRRPRVFIDSWVNQAKNLTVRWASNSKGIFFPDDFDFRALQGTAAEAASGMRPRGELMWVKGFWHKVTRVRHGLMEAPIEKALLYGYKARLDELIGEIGQKLDLVGAVTFEFSYRWKNLAEVHFRPTVSEARLRELWQASIRD